MMIAVKIAFMLGLLYLLAGIVFAVFFLSRGIANVDTTSRGSNLAFRLIILPGTLALWPVLLKKWINVKKINHDKAAS